jgi:hypothetical protein
MDLFFSEYLEGSSNNKAIEVFNPTSLPVDLTNYKIYRANNGASSPGDSLSLTGMLAPGDVYVAGNPSAVAAILAVSDTLHTITFFNGDDAMWLVNTLTGDTLDIIGVIGQDPGVNWAVGAGATSENTLVRKPTVQSGQLDWSISVTEWLVLPANVTDSLGAHTMNPCIPGLDPEVAFASTLALVGEAVDSLAVTVTIINSNSNPTTVDVVVSGGTATNGADYTLASTTVTFPGGSGAPQSATLYVLDDLLQEPTEVVILELQNPTNNATLGSDSIMIITIEDDDTPLPVYAIATVTSEDAAGVADSVGVECELRGVAVGVNMRPAGLQFTMHDGTGGINVFSFGPVSGYAVTEGDSIHVRGIIDQFNGLTEIIPDSVLLVSQGHTLPETRVVFQLDESIESELVKIIGFSFVDTSQWTTGVGPGFNYEVTNGTDTFVCRVDSDVNLFNMPRPSGSLFNFGGVGTQFDAVLPYTEGYQILHRYDADIEETQAPVAAMLVVQSGLDFLFQDLSTNWPIQWLWEFGDGDSATTSGANHTYAGPGSYTVCLTASNPAGSDSTCHVVQIVGIDEPYQAFTAFPNPASEFITVNTSAPLDRIEIHDVVGRLWASVEGQDHVIVSGLAPGTYVLTGYGSDQIWKTKLVKE